MITLENLEYPLTKSLPWFARRQIVANAHLDWLWYITEETRYNVVALFVMDGCKQEKNSSQSSLSTPSNLAI